MPIPDQSLRDFTRLLTQLEERITRLERGTRHSQLTHSSIDDDYLTIKNLQGQAVSKVGIQSDGRAAVTYGNGDPPPQPSAPLVTAHELFLAVGWDGTFVDADRPSDLARVDVHISETEGFTPDGTTAVGSLVGEGVVSVGADNQLHHVKLVAVTLADAPSVPSVEVFSTPLPVSHLAAGSIGASELAALIVLSSRIIAGATNGARVELNAGGLQAFNDASERTVHIDSADGSAAFTGEYATAETGERIIINVDNDTFQRIGFYPVTGDRPAVIQSATKVQDSLDHGTIEMRAADPSDGTGMTTRLWLLMDQLFLGYGHPPFLGGGAAEWSGQVYIDVATAYLRAGIPVIFSDILMGPFGINRIDFRHMDSAGNFVNRSEWRMQPGEGTDPYLTAPAVGVSLRAGTASGNGALFVQAGTGAYGGNERSIFAAAFNAPSARRRKRNVRDLPAPALDVIRSAPAKQWEYIPAPARTERVPRPDGDSDHDPATMWETIEFPAETPVPHTGPMADDLPPWLVSGQAGEESLDLRDLIGVLWKAVEEIGERLDGIEARLPLRG